MNTAIVDDALSMCGYIFNAIPPNHSWYIVNIAKTDIKPTFYYKNIPEIPTGFSYTYDAVPQFLREEGVIEASTNNLWYVGTGNVKDYTAPFDAITPIMIAKKYLKIGQKVLYYSKWKSSYVDEGPSDCLHTAVLINKNALVNFYIKYTSNPGNQVPNFDVSTGKFSFLGITVDIDGVIERKTLDLFVKNVGAIVDQKTLYEIRNKANYDSAVRTKGETKINDINKQVWKSLKDKLHKFPEYKKVLLFVQSDGFGIFIDKNQFTIALAPQNKS